MSFAIRSFLETPANVVENFICWNSNHLPTLPQYPCFITKNIVGY
jgi:hypothetical protein